MADPVEPRHGLLGLLGRPVLFELRSPIERRILERSAFWQGCGLPDGKGRPVLVIPGFLAGPRSARCLIHVLRASGWDAEIANVGRNSGPAYVGVAAAEFDLVRLAEASDEPVTVIGHSRGGQFARILAVRMPKLISQVITIGAPLSVKYPDFAVVKVPAELLDRTWRAGAFGEVFPELEDEVDDDRHSEFPPGIDFVSIFSRSDGIVDWRTATDPAATCIEVSASHLGLINSVAGIRAIADALARQSAVAE